MIFPTARCTAPRQEKLCTGCSRNDASQQLAAWLLHIAVDIPTHARHPWGPRFLWPLSNVAVESVSWTDLLFRLRRKVTR